MPIQSNQSTRLQDQIPTSQAAGVGHLNRTGSTVATQGLFPRLRAAFYMSAPLATNHLNDFRLQQKPLTTEQILQNYINEGVNEQDKTQRQQLVKHLVVCMA